MEEFARKSFSRTPTHKHGRARSAPEDIICNNLELSIEKASIMCNKTLQLIEEIHFLENEIRYLEQRLLVVYRNIFSEYLHVPLDSQDQEDHDLWKRRKQHELETNKEPKFSETCSTYNKSPELDVWKSENERCSDSLSMKQTNIVPHTLKDYFLKTPNELSEELVQCISSIYLKLSECPVKKPEIAMSPITSASCKSTPSIYDLSCDGGSSNKKTRTSSERSLKYPHPVKDCNGDEGAYAFMLEVPSIHLDKDRLTYATHMLRIFRSMVEHLENVDPAKMEHKAKLAFWINIYNSLVMHAFLAYGMPQNKLERMSFFKRMAYKVGKYSINTIIIETSILYCKMPHSLQWFHRLTSSKEKIKHREERCTIRRMYGLESAEPLARFGLCSGGISDPAVRVYTEEGVYNELDAAKRDFLEASVGVANNRRIILPKVVELYIKEAGISSGNLLDWVCQNVSTKKSLAIKKCLERKCNKLSTLYVEWVPYNWTFRYIFARELVQKVP